MISERALPVRGPSAPDAPASLWYLEMQMGLMKRELSWVKGMLFVLLGAVVAFKFF